MVAVVVAGRQEAVEAIIAALEVIPEPFKSMATTLVEVCAYAGTGNVLKIQHLLHICSEHHEPSEKVSFLNFLLLAFFLLVQNFFNS